MATTIDAALFERLRDDAALLALINRRVFPGHVKQGSAFPNLSFRRLSTVRPRSQQGVSGIEGARFKIDFWSTTGQEEVLDIRAQLLRIEYDGDTRKPPADQFLDGARGLWSGVRVQGSHVEDVGDTPDPPAHADDVGLYGGSLDLVVWFEL